MTEEQIKGVGSQRVTCATCGDPLRRTPSKVRQFNYCSIRCRDAAPTEARPVRRDRGITRSAWVERQCDQCGQPVSRRVSDLRPRTFCSRKCANARAKGGRPASAQIGDTYRRGTAQYVAEKTATGWLPQHRLVMERMLGRALYPGENVHHVNGVKDDNRPENLELWISTQPAGQRPQDLVAWAREIIARYG